MYAVIWIIILGFVGYQSYKKRVNEQSEKSQEQGRTDQRNKQFSRQMQKPPQRQQIHQPKNHGQKNQAKGTQQTAQGSTMAYLEEKARQDAKEHAREKLEESRRLYENTGGRCVAERLFEGDSVPKGKKCIVCGYCGAENLVPMMPREHYSCYFCREQIN